MDEKHRRYWTVQALKEGHHKAEHICVELELEIYPAIKNEEVTKKQLKVLLQTVMFELLEKRVLKKQKEIIENCLIGADDSIRQAYFGLSEVEKKQINHMMVHIVLMTAQAMVFEYIEQISCYYY